MVVGSDTADASAPSHPKVAQIPDQEILLVDAKNTNGKIARV